MTDNIAFSDVGIDRQQPVYRQIENDVRRKIVSGQLAYGTRLPSVQELARTYATSVYTIQSALKPLVADGLLERAPRRGTVVLGHKNQLTQVGIYFGGGYLGGQDGAFYRLLLDELHRELALDNVRGRIWVDTRQEADQNEPLPELAEAIRRKEVQALIGISLNPVDSAWIDRLGVPLAAASTAPMDCRVGADHAQMFRTAVSMLAAQGCRSVGLILPRPVWGPEETDHVEDIVSMFPRFLDEARDGGMEIRNNWVRTPSRRLPDYALDEFGYRQFTEMWSQPERPEGLIVYPDTVVRGVITAILQHGVRVPDELKLVFHRNMMVPVICPLRASWVQTNVRQWAVSLIEQIKHQIEGRQVRPIYLPFSASPDNSPQNHPTPESR